MAPKPSAPTAAPKSGAFERVRLEPLPEHMYEEITAEQLVIDVAALSDFTEDEVRQTGVQNNLVALHLWECPGASPGFASTGAGTDRDPSDCGPTNGDCTSDWTCSD